MDFSTILSHPDVDDIVSKLMSGNDAKSVSDWLKLKYPEKHQSHLRLSAKLLKDFSTSGYENFYKQVEKDMLAVRNGDKIDKQLAASLLNNKTYQERLNEAVETKVELPRSFQALDVLLRSRIEQVFDKIQQNPEVVNGKTDYVLIKYVEQYLALLEKYDKHVNNRPDQVIQHNHAVMYFDQLTAITQEAIRETLAEMDQEAAMLFMDKMAEKMALLKLPAEMTNNHHSSPQELLAEAKVLQENLLQKVEI